MILEVVEYSFNNERILFKERYFKGDSHDGVEGLSSLVTTRDNPFIFKISYLKIYSQEKRGNSIVDLFNVIISWLN